MKRTEHNKENVNWIWQMLKPYKSDITDIAVIFAHTGTKEDRGNRIYSIAATILRINAPPQTFESLVCYPHVKAREWNYSRISQETSSKAPEWSVVFPQVRSFLKNTTLILTLPYQDNYEDIKKICSDKKVVDLSFAVEFFLPQIDSFSPKRLWKYLYGVEHDTIAFTASEVVALSIKLIEHICGNELNDVVFPRAAAIRHYLEMSNTLFGSIFIHLTRNYGKYFDSFLNPCESPETPNWKAFLETAPAKAQIKNTESVKKINVEGLGKIYQELAKSEKDFTFRSSQVEYAQHVAQAINDEEVLSIEAGTGTGKTQGYLIPVMEFLYRNSDVRIAISTYTKSLQNQIFEQEIAFITKTNKVYKHIPVALLKGKSNYICAEKLGHSYEETWSGRVLLMWLYFVNLTYHFRDADGDQVGQRVGHYLGDEHSFYQFQREVSARRGCDAKHSRCPAQVVTAEASTARLIVTNHHKLMLLNRDPILGGIFKTYIIDEASHFEHAVRNAIGTEFNSRDTSGFLVSLEDAIKKTLERAAGELETDIKNALSAIVNLRNEMIQFSEILKKVRFQIKQGGGQNELPTSNAFFKEGKVVTHLKDLRYLIQAIAENLKWLTDADKCRMLKILPKTQERLKRNLAELKEQDSFLKIIIEACATTNQIITYDVFSRHWEIISGHVDVSDIIRENLYLDTKGLIYTSATICMNGNHETFKRIVGMDQPFFLDDDKTIPRKFRHICLGSPFSGVSREMIVPTAAVKGDYTNKSAWINYVVKTLPELIKENKGRTLVLFSSYQDLVAVEKSIGNGITKVDFPLLIQHKGFPTGDLCDEFRAIKESVLFGVDTFWYGVDFKGDTLTQVIITRIPYPNPMDALNMARKKTMRAAEYWERYQYDTYIKMKQGIGRLIRCETDKGKVVVLDSRYIQLKEKFVSIDENEKYLEMPEQEDAKAKAKTQTATAALDL